MDMTVIYVALAIEAILGLQLLYGHLRRREDEECLRLNAWRYRPTSSTGQANQESSSGQEVGESNHSVREIQSPVIDIEEVSPGNLIVRTKLSDLAAMIKANQRPEIKVRNVGLHGPSESDAKPAESWPDYI